MTSTKKPSATIDVYIIDESKNEWSWQIDSCGNAITPQRGRTVNSARAANKAALVAAEKFGLHVTKEKNLEK